MVMARHSIKKSSTNLRAGQVGSSLDNWSIWGGGIRRYRACASSREVCHGSRATRHAVAAADSASSPHRGQAQRPAPTDMVGHEPAGRGIPPACETSSPTMIERGNLHGTNERWAAYTHDRPAIAADIRHFIETVRQDVPLTANTTVLDVGCGWGITTFHLARQCKVQGIDRSPDNLRLNPVRTVSLMDATRLGFADASFDVVLAHHVLHHVVDVAGALAEMARVCRRYVVVADLNKWNPVNQGFVLLGAEELPKPYFSAKWLERAVEGAGMRVIRRRTWGTLSPYATSSALVPLQRKLWFEHPLGLEHLIIAEKA